MSLPFEYDARHTAVVDWETRCGLSLKDVGVHLYGRHPTFKPLLLAMRIGTERLLWEPHKGPLPDRMRNIALDTTVSFASYGDFDRTIWKILAAQGLVPEVKDRRWRDIMSIARSRNLPASLAEAAKALDLSSQKLESGKALIDKFCKPMRKKKTDGGIIRFVDPADAADDWKTFIEYAVADVDTAWEMLCRLGFLSSFEEETLRATRAMNDRGVPFSEERLRIIDRRAEEAKGLAAERIKAVTGVTPGNANAMRDWINKEAGLDLETVRAQELLEAVEDNDVPPHVQEIIILRGIVASKASSKAAAALELGLPDLKHPGLLRVYDQFVYAGASATQRWSARGVQPQNFKRTSLNAAETERAWDRIAANPSINPEKLTEEIELLAQLMRSTIMHPAGISWTDLSNIELRVGALVGANIVRANGGELTGISDLETSFRAKVDTYSHFSVDIYNAIKGTLAADHPVITAENAKKTGWRNTAKTVLLSSQYMVGVPTLQRSLRKDTGVEFADEQAEGLHEAFRTRFPQFPAAWDFLKRATLHCVRNKSSAVVPGFGRYDWNGKDLELTKLSGSKVVYRNARVDRYLRYGRQFHGFMFDAVGGSGVVVDTPHAGTLFEHIVSSTSRDLVADAMIKAERAGLTLIMSVHDELVVEGGKSESDELHRIMGDAPEWASKWPLDRESNSEKQWGK